MRDYVNATPRYDSDRRFVLDCLCEAVDFVYGHTNNNTLGNLNVVVDRYKEKVRSTPQDNPIEYAQALVYLGQVLKERFNKSGNPKPFDDLDAAIDALEQAVALFPDQKPDNLELLCELGNLLRIQSKRNNSLDGMVKAIQTIEKAIETSLEGHHDPGLFFDSYGNALRAKYELTNSLVDLNRAVEACEKAVGYTSNNHSHRWGRLSNLSITLLLHSDRTLSSMAELNRAISVAEEAVKSTPGNHSDLTGMLNNLSNGFSIRFERAGSLADLTMCVKLNRQAVNATRAEKGHDRDLAECLLILGENLRCLSERMGSLDELEEAIRILREAVRLVRNDDPKKAICLGSLGSALAARFHRLNQMDDLDEGIRLLNGAIDLTPKRHPYRPLYMTKVGNSLASRFRKGNSMGDLNASVEWHENAARETQEDHPRHAICLTNLGNALAVRFDIMELMEDLDRAIKAFEGAVGVTPPDHPRITAYERNLGSALDRRFEKSRNPEDINAAIECNERALAIPSARPSLRISVARAVAILRIRRRQNEFNDVERAAMVLKEAVELLPMTSPLSLKRSHQQDALSVFAGLASDAAALSLHSGGTAFEALQLLELGRGVMGSLQQDARADITSLRDVNPELAAQFEDVRNKLDSQEPDETGDETLDHSSYFLSSIQPHGNTATLPDRHTMLENFNDVVNKIRNEVFPNFLRGPTADELTNLANEGPIVVFNINMNRSDVFLVTRKSIDTLPLPKLRYHEVETKAKLSRRVIEGRAARVRKGMAANEADTMNDILKWLWDAAVFPILTELERNNALSDVNKHGLLPRVWWVTSGWLSLLPIHAAGYHADGSTENALDRVISSYAPTIKSLRYARDKEMSVVDETDEHALLVSMENTPEQNCLPGAEEEIDSLDGTIPAFVERNILRGAAKDAVMPFLRDCHICHFACHGESHPDDPSLSRLLLADWKSNPLSVNDIVGLRPKHAKLAYLSACSAAESQVEALLDESIHLMSAFLLAGFPSIVGTLWQIRDRISVDDATLFYRIIFEGSRSIKVKESAAALNSAIRCIRNQLQSEYDNSSIWAPYIHVGV